MGHVIFCITFLGLLHFITGEPCKYDGDPCKCKTSDFVLDLNPLMNSRGGADFNVTGDEQYTYYIQPCNKQMTSIFQACIQKSPVLVSCQIDTFQKYAFGLGVLNEFDAVGSAEEQYYILSNSFLDLTDGKIRKLHLTIHCGDQESTLTYNGHDGTESPITYSFTLATRHFCKEGGGGISIGSVMVIIFFVLLVVYLVGGILLLKFVKKAQGREVIPNYTFWTAIPLLIKDGFLFTFRGCKGTAAYGKI